MPDLNIRDGAPLPPTDDENAELETPQPSRWDCYWRGSILFSLLVLAVVFLFAPSGADATKAFILTVILNIVIYPFYLIAVSLAASPLMFVAACIALTGSPLLLLIWGGLIQQLGAIAQALGCFTTMIIISLIITCACGALRFTDVVPIDLASRRKQARRERHENIKAEFEKKKQRRAALRATPTVTPTPKPLRMFHYEDNKNYYSLDLPEYERIVVKDSGARSKKLMTYGNDLSVTIIANRMYKDWDASEARQLKTQQAEQGRAGIASRYVVIHDSTLVRYPNANGYKLELGSSQPNRFLEMAAFVMVKDGLSVTLSVSCTSEHKMKLFRIIAQSIENTIRVNKRPTSHPKTKNVRRSRQTTTKKPKAVEVSPKQAQKRINVQGVMQKKGENIALIDGHLYHIGDVVSVPFGGQTFRFRITKVGTTADRVEFENIE